MTKHYPQEFRDDVVKVARLRQTSMRQVALDFGISAATLYQWLGKAEIKEGLREVASLSPAQLTENRELRRRNLFSTALLHLVFTN
jgi:transposase-like protein